MSDKELIELARRIIFQCEDSLITFDGCGDAEYSRCPVCENPIDTDFPLEKRGHAPHCDLLRFLQLSDVRQAPRGPGGVFTDNDNDLSNKAYP